MKNLSTVQREILNQCRIASVATIDADGMPHLTAVWFLFDGESFLVSISSASAKARNIRTNQNIALMIDVRQTGKELGVSVSGVAEVLEGEIAREAIDSVYAKYLTQEALTDPEVGPVFATFSDIAIRLRPTRWISWNMGAVDQQLFDGKLAAKSYLKPLQV